MKMMINIAAFMVMGGVFTLIVYILQKIVPVRYFRSVLWGFRNKRYILAPVSVFLICVASILVFSSFNFHFLLLFGKAEPALVVGESLDIMTYINPMKKGEGLQEHELTIQTVTRASLYPGQTLKDAVNDRVLIKYPGYKHYNILFTNVIPYIFINIIVVMFLFGSLLTGFFLMMYHAVDLQLIKKPLKQQEIIDNFKERIGISWLKALGIVTLFFAVSGITASFISTRFNPMIEYSKNAADKAREIVLAKAVPGAVLKGQVVKKNTFSITEYASRRDEGRTNRRTVSYHFKAYMVKFDDIYEYPVFVSVVYFDGKIKPEAQKKVDMFEELLKSKAKGDFQVNEDYSVGLKEKKIAEEGTEGN